MDHNGFPHCQVNLDNKIFKLFQNSKYEKGVFGSINLDNKISKLFANSFMNKTCYNYGKLFVNICRTTFTKINNISDQQMQPH